MDRKTFIYNFLYSGGVKNKYILEKLRFIALEILPSKIEGKIGRESGKSFHSVYIWSAVCIPPYKF